MRRVARLLVLGAVLISGIGVSVATRAAGQFDITAYGAVANDATDDSAAVQRANDAAVKAGGGRVFVPDGTYIVGGVYLGSGIELAGSRQAILKDPNGSDSAPIVRTHTSTTTGSIAKGSKVLTVANNYRIRPGALLAVRAAGGGAIAQTTTLTAAMDKTSATVPIARFAGYPTSGFLRVEDEAIAFSSTTGQVTFKRASLGTAGAAHAAGSKITLERDLMSRVVSVSGTTVTLADPAAFSASGATVTVGTVGVSINGLTFDGSRPSGTTTQDPVAIFFRLTRGSSLTGSLVRNAAHGGVKLDLGTTGSVVSGSTFIDNGTRATKLGAAVWIFQSASNNVVRDNVISGDTYHGIVLDDRTVRATAWDGPVDGNVVERNTIDVAQVDSNRGISLAGGSHNVIRDNTVRNVQFGVAVASELQGLAPLATTYNDVAGNMLSGHKTGLFAIGAYNTFRANRVTATTYPYVDQGVGNVRVAEALSVATSVSGVVQREAARVTSSLGGISCTAGDQPGPCSASFVNRDDVILTATPPAGATAAISGDCSAGPGLVGQAVSCVVTMSVPHTVTATFTGPTLP